MNNTTRLTVLITVTCEYHLYGFEAVSAITRRLIALAQCFLNLLSTTPPLSNVPLFQDP